MKSALLGTAAAVALVLGCGLTASVDAQQAAGSAPAPVEQPAGAPQDARASITPDGSQQRSAPASAEQLRLRDGATVTVLRPVMARREQASGQEEAVSGAGAAPRLAGRRRRPAVGDRPRDQRAPDLQGAPDEHGRPQGAALRRHELEVAARPKPGRAARPEPVPAGRGR